MDNQNRNFILAMALSLGVILIWSILFPAPEAPVDPNEPAAVATDGSGADIALTPPLVGDGDTIVAGATPDAVVESPRIEIDTPSLAGSISLTGGRLDDLQLRDYFETIDDDSPIVRLLSPVGDTGAYYALYGWTPGGDLGFDDVPGANTLWDVESGTALTVDTPVTLRWDNGAGLVFRRTISVDDHFLFTVTQSVENTTETAARMAPYGIIARHGLPDDLQNFFILHEGVVQSTDGTLNELDYDDMADLDYLAREGARAEVTDVAEAGWIGFTDKNWMTTLIPESGQPFTAVSRYVEGADIYQTEARLPAVTIEPGQTIERSTRLFAGAKEWETIRNYEADENIDGFINSIDWGK